MIDRTHVRYSRRMALFENPTDPHVVENLRRSITMLAPGQPASIERDRALVLLEELQRLQQEQRVVATQLRALVARIEGP